MRAPFLTLLAVVLGWPLLILAVVAGYLAVQDWIQREYPAAPEPVSATARIQHPGYRALATRALARFATLPQREQETLLETLRARLLIPGRWLAGVEAAGHELICLGEKHDEETRKFLARSIFPRLPAATLMLEATPAELEQIRRRMAAGRGYYPLLDADIAGVLRAARSRNPAVVVTGIEETARQRRVRLGTADGGSRDASMVTNLFASFRPHARNVVLLGALHCADEARWLFHRIRSRWLHGAAGTALSVRVIGEHESGAVESFVYFLDELGLPRRSFVLSGDLPPWLARQFPLLQRGTLRPYDAVVVYRVGPQAAGGPPRGL